ncbi:hypothetical protein HMI54_001414 [Coelomomyces lativittatus]|nr:hypothetical protein HMI54_001414 [Coelomomyces lativittatus]
MILKDQKEADAVVIEASSVEKQTGRVVSLRELKELVKERPPLNFIWNGIKEHTLNFLVAPPKVGKTILCENLGMSIAAGQEKFLDMPIWDGTEVLTTRVGNDAWLDNFITPGPDTPRYFTTSKEWDWLTGTIKEYNPRLTIIDSLTSLNFNSRVEESSVCVDLTNRLKKVIEETGTTIVVIHHTQKLKPELLSLANMAGSRVLGAEADAVIGMNRTPSGKRYIKLLANRYMDDYSETVQLFNITEECWIELGGKVNESEILREFDNRVDTTNKELVHAYISEYTGDDCSVIIETSKMYQELVDAQKMSKPTLHSSLNKLVDDNFISKIEKGRYALVKQE